MDSWQCSKAFTNPIKRQPRFFPISPILHALADGVYFKVIIKQIPLHNVNSLIIDPITKMGVGHVFEQYVGGYFEGYFVQANVICRWICKLRSFLNQDFTVLQCMQTVVKRMLFTIKFMAVWVFDKFIGYLETFSQIKQSGVA